MNKGSAIVGFILCFLAGIAGMWGIDRAAGAHPGSASKEGPGATSIELGKVNPGAAKVELYVMSRCPYGVQAENGFKDAIEKLGADVDFHVDFIGQGDANSLSSMHGPGEVKGDIVQVCAQKYTAKWFQLILCQNQNARENDTNWEQCATQIGAQADKIRSCADGDEGKQLLKASFDRSSQKGARGSPTIYIGGQQYNGGRRSTDFMKAICNAYSGNRPAACNDIPESPKVNVTLLSDKRCEECNPARMQGMIGRAVASPVFKTLDYSDPEGKKLFDSIKDAVKPLNLPVAVFDSTLDADKDASSQLGRMLKPAGNNKVLAMGGDWNPVCADPKGCDLDECKSTIACRPEEPGKLEVFVMSECPYGVKGLNAMQEVLANFTKNKAKVDFSVHYIGDGDAKGGLKSMHGPGEVDEDVREICAADHFGKDAKYMDYIWCRNKDIRGTDWEKCATKDTGVDAAVIKKCVDGEGKDLLEKSFAYSAKAGIGASPTWLANGKYKFSGIDAETIKTEFCKHNKLAGCDEKLSGQAPAPAGGAPAQPGGCGG